MIHTSRKGAIEFLNGTQVEEQVHVQSVKFITKNERTLQDYQSVILCQKSFSYLIAKGQSSQSSSFSNQQQPAQLSSIYTKPQKDQAHGLDTISIILSNFI